MKHITVKVNVPDSDYGWVTAMLRSPRWPRVIRQLLPALLTMPDTLTEQETRVVDTFPDDLRVKLKLQ